MSKPRSNERGTTYTTGWGPRIILVTMFMLYISDYADRYVVAGMVEHIKRDWDITDSQAGMLLSAVVFFITLFSIPSAILVDRWSRRKMVAIMTFFWSLATLACAFANNFTQLLVARSFIGIGESGYAPAGSAMLAAAYPEEKRARVFGVWNVSIPIGMGTGLVAGGYIARTWGWQHAFGLVAVPGMILAIIAWFLPDYKSVRPEDETNKIIGSFWFDLKTVMRIPSAVLTYLGFAMNVSITTSLTFWLPSYFERTGIAKPGESGMLTMSVFALVLVGAPLGGILSDMWRRRRPEGRLYFPAMTSAVAALILLVAFQFPGQKWTQLPMLVAFGIFVTAFIAPAASVTQDVVHPGLRAFSYAMCVIVQHLAGDIWSPTIVGALSDRVGLDKAFMLVPAWGFLAALFFFLASRTYARDLDRVRKVELEAEK